MMNELEIKKYQSLNKLANCDGIVLFGSKELFEIPLCELKQAFDINDDLYNRSFESVSLADAQNIYTECISEIKPDTLFIQFGSDDIDLFANDKDKFISLYRNLVSVIKRSNKKCRIAIVSLKNHNSDKAVAEMNSMLKYIADSENVSSAIYQVKKLVALHK